MKVEAIVFDLGGTVLEIRHDAIGAIVGRHGGTMPPGWRDAGERGGRQRMEETLRAGSAPHLVWRAFFLGMLEAAGVAHDVAVRAFDDVRDYHRTEHPVEPRVARDAGGAHGARRARLSARGGLELRRARRGAARTARARAQLRVRRRLARRRRREAVAPHLRDGLRAAGASARRCAYVGDVMAFDVEGARAAGLVPVLFDAYGSYEDEDGPPDGAHARGPAELLALFPARARRSA
jgi:FMN phosphatase YigB (HAD superfamily)